MCKEYVPAARPVIDFAVPVGTPVTGVEVVDQRNVNGLVPPPVTVAVQLPSEAL